MNCYCVLYRLHGKVYTVCERGSTRRNAVKKCMRIAGLEAVWLDTWRA